jgi:uncharacterized protein
MKASDVIEFDSACTAEFFGFNNVYEYYRESSSVRFLPTITIPSLLLSALDDPISNHEMIPYAEVLKNPKLILATTAKGGHLAWFTFDITSILPGKRWMAEPVREFIDAIVIVYDVKLGENDHARSSSQKCNGSADTRPLER